MMKTPKQVIEKMEELDIMLACDENLNWLITGN